MVEAEVNLTWWVTAMLVRHGTHSDGGIHEPANDTPPSALVPCTRDRPDRAGGNDSEPGRVGGADNNDRQAQHSHEFSRMLSATLTSVRSAARFVRRTSLMRWLRRDAFSQTSMYRRAVRRRVPCCCPAPITICLGSARWPRRCKSDKLIDYIDRNRSDGNPPLTTP